MKICFFNNGNTEAFDNDGNQIPELQVGWIELYFNILEIHGYDPAKVDFILPDGKKAIPYKTADNLWNWNIK